MDNLKVKLIFLIFSIFSIFMNTFLLALEKRHYSKDDENVKNVFILTDQGNVLNSVGYLKKNVLDKEQISKNETELGEQEKNIDYEEEYQKGLRHFNEGNYKDALEIFSSLLTFYPKRRNILFYLKRSEEIILENCDNLKFKNLKDLANYYLVSARSYVESKEYIKAYDFYEKLFLIDNSHKSFEKEVLDIDNMMKNILEKRESFRIEEYHYAKSYFLFKDGNMEKCIDEWEKIVELNPNKSEIQNLLSLFKNKNYKTKFDLRKENLFLNEGIKLYNHQNYEKAINFFYKVLLISDNDIAKLYIRECKAKIEQKSKKQDVLYLNTAKIVEIKKNKYEEKGKKEKEKEETLKEIINKRKNLKLIASGIEEKDNNIVKNNSKNKDEIKIIVENLYKKGLDFYYSGDMENAKLCWEKILEYEPKNKKVLKRLKKMPNLQKQK